MDEIETEVDRPPPTIDKIKISLAVLPLCLQGVVFAKSNLTCTLWIFNTKKLHDIN
jgi:hypothetical protein